MSATGWRSWLGAGLLFVSSAQTRSDIPPGAAAAMAKLADQLVLGVERQGKVLAVPGVLSRAKIRVAELFPNQNFTVLFVDDPSPNARAFPNGAILVNSGLALDLDTASDWEFVLAHEVAHLALGHFDQQLNDPSTEERAGLEQAADQMAMQRMTQADRDMRSVPALLLRTRNKGSQIMVPAAKDLIAPSNSPDPAIVEVQKAALERTLATSQIDRAKAFLDRELPWLHPDDVSRWQWMVRQRNGLIEDTPGLLKFALPAAVAKVFSGQLPNCAKTSRQFANALNVGQTTRWGSTTFVRDKHWRIALQTGRQLTLTPDRSALTRLDIWNVNRTPTGIAAKPLPCPNTQLALWHALSEFRGIAPSRKITLDSATPLVNGLRLTMTMVDETGLRWTLRGWRIVEGERTFYALFKAPAKHFFPRHVDIAERTVRGFFGPI